MGYHLRSWLSPQSHWEQDVGGVGGGCRGSAGSGLNPLKYGQHAGVHSPCLADKEVGSTVAHGQVLTGGDA